MINRPAFPFTGLPMVLFLLISKSALAQTPPLPPASPLHLSVTKPLTPVRDVLASLAKQSGTPILADDTVVDTLGLATIDKPTVPEMLDAIKTLLPALSWQRVTIARNAPIPDANALSAEARELQALMVDRIIITSPDTPLTMDYSRVTSRLPMFIDKADSAASNMPTIADPADRVVYLVTNETVREQRATLKEIAAVKQMPIEAQKMQDAMKPTPQTGLQRVISLYSQLPPTEQRDNLESMVFQWQKIIRATNPAVLQEVEQNYPDLSGQ